jgi:predicted phage terminase large subunit-like protein
LQAIDLSKAVQIGPQPGPQFAFLETKADIAIYGGAAGGGKSYALLLDPLRHHDKSKDFGAVIFRKTSVQVRNEGGLWDESMKIYSLFGARPREAMLEWRFAKGMSISFSNLEYEKDVFNYQGAQMAWIGFDELTHFSREQFFYMLSRNRSTSGVKPRIRATCNPDPDSWVREFIDWWIGPDGLAIPERSGVLRWFVRIDDNFIWADSPEEIRELCGEGESIQPKSVTFIPSKLQDNKILMTKDPGYLANLLAQNRVDRERLLHGNWDVRATAGMFFQRHWFPLVDAVPSGWTQAVRFWDRAATKPSETNPNPDWTRGLKLYKYPDGRFCVVDLKSIRDTPGQVERFIRNVASHDSNSVKIVSQQDPGSAGVLEAENFIKMLAGYWVSIMVTSKDKATRAKPVSAQAEAGNVMVLRAGWNEEFFSELENFSDNPKDYDHDDIVDVLSGAFNELCGGLSLADVL